MPAPGEGIPAALLIQQGNEARDQMIARMQMATPGGPVFAVDEPSLGKTIQENRKLVAEALKDGLIKAAGPGAVMAALDDPLYRTVERALFPFTDIGARCTPEHRWRAAEHFRPFFAIPALVEAIAPLVKPLAGYTDAELAAELDKRKTT